MPARRCGGSPSTDPRRASASHRLVRRRIRRASCLAFGQDQQGMLKVGHRGFLTQQEPLDAVGVGFDHQAMDLVGVRHDDDGVAANSSGDTNRSHPSSGRPLIPIVSSPRGGQVDVRSDGPLPRTKRQPIGERRGADRQDSRACPDGGRSPCRRSCRQGSSVRPRPCR